MVLHESVVRGRGDEGLGGLGKGHVWAVEVGRIWCGLWE